MNSSRRQTLIRLLLVTAVLLTVFLIHIRRQNDDPIAIALAKSSQMMALGSDLSRTLSLAELPPNLSGAQFVQAVRLAESEAAPWGCPAYSCALATFYDMERSVTLNRVIDLSSQTVLAAWEEPHTRPAGSIHILPLALQIAAADPQVQATLGDIGAAEPAMIPMSGWLADDDCRRDWCVDLTFHAPQGDGRIYHIFVNLEKERVARTFYTRGRPVLNVPPPVSQRDAFSDGCHKQSGWSICWEMTADDGLNFTEATFNGRPVFHSAKVGQVEAWYPSWPGGYRDEIGLNGTVRPFGGTEIIKLADGFEVRQLFTEFTRWPNCICCYRYEQTVRLFADGAFEFDFVSHGPGCDDLSIYRPFWRIALADTQGLWHWQATDWLATGLERELQPSGEGEWVTAVNEQELHPVVQPLSPDGHRLAWQNQTQLYKWRMVPTDPLAQDEARLFLLRAHENEGDGPILPGPGDSYEPPRQWLGEETISGEDVVMWFVPLLKTKKGGPWWCMPDPQPNINQCNAVLRAEPALALYQSAVTAPTRPPADQTAVPTTSATTTPAATATPRPIDGETAEEIILNAGCSVCHQIGALGESGKVGPDLSAIGQLAGQRRPGLAAADYIRQSILEPNAYLAPDCPNSACLPNIMPRDYRERLTAVQMETLVAYLLAQGGPPAATATLPVVGQTTPTTAPTGNDSGTAVPRATPPPEQNPSPTLPDLGSPYAVLLLLLVVVVVVVLFFVRRRP